MLTRKDGGMTAGIIVAVLALSGSAWSAPVTLYSTGFEAPEFSLGPIKDQNLWRVQGDTNNANVVDYMAAGGSQSLRLDIPAYPENVYAGSWQKDWDWSPLDAGQTTVCVSAKVWVGSGGTTTQMAHYTDKGIVFINMQNGMVFANYWEPERDLYLDGGIGLYHVEDWNDLTLTVDYLRQQFEVTCEGVSFGLHDLPTDGPSSRFQGWSFGGIYGPRVSYVDDLNVTALPEPATLLFMVLGSCLMARHKRH